MYALHSLKARCTSGQLVYQFTMTTAEVLKGLGRERLRSETRDEVINYFIGEGLSAEYDEVRKRFRVNLDLQTVVMSPEQAKAFVSVLKTWRSPKA